MTSSPDPMRAPLDMELLSPEGAAVALGDVLSFDLTVIQLVRYFGCLPCQEWLIDLDKHATSLATSGVGAAAIGGSADYQATWLREEQGVSMPLLLDPEHTFRDAVDASRPLGWRMADPRGAAAYARTLSHGYKPQTITKDTVRSPGVVILSGDGVVRWRFIGKRIGHYPSMGEVLTAVDALR